jgi:signal transduction histidine kinase
MEAERNQSAPAVRLLRLDILDKLALGIAAVFTFAAAAGLTFFHRAVSESLSRMDEQAEVAIRYSGVFLLALAAVVLLAMIAMVRWIVVLPVRRLTRSAAEIGASADLSRRVSLPQSDEIGVLSLEFDRMLDRLASARRNLMAYSFLAGAENAAVRTLHDVGNAAAPLTVSLDLLRESIAGVGIARFRDRIGELAGTDDPQRRQALAEGLHRDLSAAQDELERARRNLSTAVECCSRMEDILRTSAGRAVGAPVTVAVSPRDLISTAISMVPPDARTGISVRLDNSLDNLPRITNAHPGLYAVFYAILTNAVEAINATRSGGEIEVRGASPAPGMLSITIDDTGSGIPAEHLPLVFDREFTTRDRPKTMFSLHHCATVVAASGGAIGVQSAGPGKGTTVTVSLKSAAPRQADSTC